MRIARGTNFIRASIASVLGMRLDEYALVFRTTTA
jgi:hypothetical protein